MIRNGLFEAGYRSLSGPLVVVTSSGIAVPHRMYHVAGVIDGNHVRLFVDGVFQGVASETNLKVSAVPIAIGTNPPSAYEVFDGTIDEVRISKVARYSGNFTPARRFTPDADTIALYHFDDGSGDITHDVSGHGNDAKIVGAKWVRADSLVPSKSGVSAPPDGLAQPNKPWNTPVFQQWMKTVAVMPAERQVEAVSKKLVELNPGFDGKVTGPAQQGPPKVKDGVIKEFVFHADDITDISPVRALAGLRYLRVSGSKAGRGKLSDLSPLSGLKLEQISCGGTKVSDLSPLQGMPLSVLNFGDTQVADLSPLKGMLLTKLSCHHTQVSDLSPLEGMKLTEIAFTPTNITEGLDIIRQMKSLKSIGTFFGETIPSADFWKKYDAGEFGRPGAARKLAYLDPAFQAWMKTVAALSAEQQIEAVGKKLMELNPGFDGKVTNWEGNGPPPIANGVVTEFALVNDNVTDISPVRALAELRLLKCSGSDARKGELTDLSPLAGMKLTALDCNSTQVSNLSPLEGMPLEQLTCYRTPISDLSALVEMKLAQLNCGNTLVSSLSPLKGMPIKSLLMGSTNVADISPLMDMPLTTLACYGKNISDLSPLRGMNLIEVSIMPKYITKGMDAIREMKSIKGIGIANDKRMKPEDFWKKYDAGEFGNPPTSAKPWESLAFQQWMKGVRAMSAEKQIEAVSKKLMELNPGFDGEVTGPYGKGTPKIENGVVTVFEFVTHQVTDISPVRALTGLKILTCSGGSRFNGKLSDLSPLQGMPLTAFYCIGTKVSDLSPLEGMKLTDLICGFTQVSDLSPLKGMRLTTLNCGKSNVFDLSPLTGMPLKKLECYNTQVSGLLALRGMQLNHLNCCGTAISDLSPLAGMPLTKLVFENTSVSDLSPLRGITLKLIAFTPKNITKGMEVIRQMKSLTTVGLHENKDTFSPAEFWKKYDAGEFGKPAAPAKLAYLDPAFQQWMKTVAVMPAEQQIAAVSKKLTELNPGFDGRLTNIPESGSPKVENGIVTEVRFHSLHVTDISPLRVFSKMKALICYPGGNVGSQLSDLSPLQGAPLTELRCSGTSVFDLSPLEGMPLRTVQCDHTPVSDLSPLEDCKGLESLNVKGTKVTPATVAALQKALPNCKIVWDDPAKATAPVIPRTK